MELFSTDFFLQHAENDRKLLADFIYSQNLTKVMQIAEIREAYVKFIDDAEVKFSFVFLFIYKTKPS